MIKCSDIGNKLHLHLVEVWYTEGCTSKTKFKSDSKIDKFNAAQLKHSSATKASKTYNLITCLNPCLQHLKDNERYRNHF